MRLKPMTARMNGFGSMVPVDVAATAPDATTAEYVLDQAANNVRVTREYLEPILRQTSSYSVLDVGCGIGTSVETLLEDGYEAFGVDLAPLTRHWSHRGIDAGRLFVVDPITLALPFHDNSLDFAFTFGVIEHIGTVDGHATRRADYHKRRRQWLREVVRVVRPGGRVLIGGPNRACPVDFSHGLDADSSWWERRLSTWAGVTVHRTWGDYFLWSYADIPRYLEGLHFEMQALGLDGLLKFGRLPGTLRPLARWYVRHLPASLRSTGLNPWVMALVTKQ